MTADHIRVNGPADLLAEVALVSISAAFGAPRATAILATLGCRIVNYWLPLPTGAVAYLRLRRAGGRPPGRGDRGQGPEVTFGPAHRAQPRASMAKRPRVNGAPVAVAGPRPQETRPAARRWDGHGGLAAGPPVPLS